MIEISDFVKGVFCVGGAFLLQFSLGTIYTFGNISPYIVSYLKYRTSNTWLNGGYMVWIFSTAVFSQAFTMSLGGLLEKKIGARITCLIGSWSMSLGTILTYYTVQYHLLGVICTYGLIFGMGTGLTYSVAVAAPMKWFPTRRGLVTGIVVGGYGLGSLVFNLMQTKIINPKNISPNATTPDGRYFNDPLVLDNVPICFVIIGGAYAAIQLLGVILLTDASARKSSGEEKCLVNNSDGENEELTKNKAYDAVQEGEPKNVNEDFSVREAIRDIRFWIVWTTFIFNGIVIVAISSLYKIFGQTFISNDRFFSTVGAVAAIFNSGGRLIWGRLLDKFSYRIMMSSLTILMAVMMGTFYICSIIKTEKGAQAMYFIWVCLLFFCLAGSFAMFPTVTSQSFGNTNMAIIYGIVFSGYAVSSVLGAILFSLLLKYIHFSGLFVIATISALISLVLTQFFTTQTIKNSVEGHLVNKLHEP